MDVPFPGLIKAQAILQGKSNLARDRFINTFHFLAPGGIPPTAAHFTNVSGRIQNFYNLGIAAGPALATFLASFVSRDPLGCSIRMYDMGAPHPRFPVTVPFTMGGDTAQPPLPLEVAVCLSYYGTQNRVGQRGRIYFGPLNQTALSSETLQPDVPPGLVSALIEGGETLASPGDTTIPVWVVYSPAKAARLAKNGTTLPAETGSVHTITNGWVDDEYDTQRRRGLKARSRVLRTFV